MNASTRFSSRLLHGVVLTLATGLCWGAASSAQTVIQTNISQTSTSQTSINQTSINQTNISQTNIVVTNGGTNTTNEIAGYSGLASVALGYSSAGFISAPGTYLLSATGDVREASGMGQLVTKGLEVGLSSASIVGQEKAAAAHSSMADLRLTVSNAGIFGFGGSATTIAADFVMSEARAGCFTNETTNGVVLNGTSHFSGLTVNGLPVAVTGQANQFVNLSGGGFLVINEQAPAVVSTSVNGQSFTTEGVAVNALHVVLPLSGVNVVVGTSSAGVACGAETNKVCGDFITGGGWITGTPSGQRANFGVAAGLRSGAFWGHLNYVDQASGLRVKSTAVTGYQPDPNDPDCRIVDYLVSVDGHEGTARVRVCDKGEPGVNDRFEIQIVTCPLCASAVVGYYAAGDLGGTRPGGGNLQLHQCHE